ncbi:hypothetical protein FRB94_007693 [Tulasnella sp. JGI-2019a]|nr:hypothetical protein FRB94_007693 [Tulasnella sp. JGI-2019a]
MWRMVWDIIRFNALASRAVRKPREIGSMNLGEWLRRHSFSDEFINDYILPITASIWSTPPDTCALEFPAHTHFQFMHNHHFLQLTGKPPWMSIKGGSQLYVDRIISRVPADRIHLSTPIHSVSSSLDGGGKKLLTTASGETGEFDHVVLATHTDISLRILQNGTDGATELESKVLGGFTWAKNRVVVHHDDQLMPQRKSAWSCWNFITTSAGASTSTSTIDPVCLTYNMNQLQGIQSSKHGNVFVTLNPPPSLEPKEGTIVKDGVMEHPMFTADSTWAQENLHRIQNTRGVTFAGAWTKHGFHEDGFSSGLHVASKYIGIRRDAPPPFEIKLNHDRPIETGGERWADFVELLEFRRRACVGTVSTIWTWQKQAVGLVWWALGVIIQMILVGVVISFAMVKKHLFGKDVDVPQDHQDGSLLESKNGNWPAKMGLPDVELKDHGE